MLRVGMESPDHSMDFTKGSITSNMIKFALPLMAGNLLQQMYNLADAWVVGKFLGSNALAAVGSSYTLMTFLTSIMLGLCMGSGSGCMEAIRTILCMGCPATVAAVSRSVCSGCPAVSRFVLPSTAGSVYKLALRRTNVASDGNYRVCSHLRYGHFANVAARAKSCLILLPLHDGDETRNSWKPLLNTS